VTQTEFTLEQARAWYPQADPVHDFSHVERVYRMAEKLARVEGADLLIVRTAALLHDAEGSAPADAGRANHHRASANFAAQVLLGAGWPAEGIDAVLHCIRAHRYRGDQEPPVTIEARVLFDADKLDVIGAIGVARTIAYAALAGEPIYAEPSPRFFETGEKTPGEPHSAYHEYLFKLVKIKERLFTSSARQIACQRHAYMVGYFCQLADEIGSRK
jgi:uncharacterized protein